VQQFQFRFDGDTIDPRIDTKRLATQMGQVYLVMRDGRWRTLSEIAARVDGSEAGISARLRDLRKQRFADLFRVADVERRRRNGAGTWEYRVEVRA